MKKFLWILVLGLLSASLWAAMPTTSSSPAGRVTAEKPVSADKIPGNPKVITWAAIDSIDPGASRLAAVATMGKVYRLGGEGTAGRLGWVEQYDPATGVWISRTAIPVGVSNLCVAEYQDKLYVPGGWTGTVYPLALQRYNQWGNSWYIGADSMPEGRYGASCAVVADTMYVFGGYGPSGISRSCFAYSFNEGTWSLKDSMATARQFTAAVTVNGKIYVIGGVNASLTDLTTVEMYDPATGVWSTKTPMLTGRGGLGASNIGGRVYAFGGGWTSYLNTVEYYTTEADTAGGTPWVTDTSFVNGRRTLGAAALGNDAYVVGGWSGGYRNYVEKGVTDAPVVNDASVTKIDIPQFLGNYGVVVPVYVNVQNNGPHKHYNVPVTLQIDSAGTVMYNLNRWCDLDSAGVATIIFPDWPAAKTVGTVHTFKAWVNWPLDQNAANDTLTVTTEIKDAIWYQHQPYTSSAFTAQNFEPTYDAYDSYILDDFWISGVDTVWLDSVYVGGAYWNGTGPLDSIGIIITPDSSSLPSMSNVYFSGYYTAANYTENLGSLMIRFPQQVKVYDNGPGLWISFQGQMNLSPNGQYGVFPYTGEFRGSYGGIFYNPGGGFGFGTGYNPVSVLGAINNVAFSLYGSLTPTGVAGQPDQALAPKFGLKTARPNPSYTSASISYTLPKAETVKLAVYSITGQLVRSLVNNNQAAGEHRVSWDGRDGKGNRVAAGIYLYRLAAGNNTASGKIVMLR